MTRFIIPSILIGVLAATNVCAAPTAVVKDLAYPGGTERTLLLAADQPKATVILFPGGDGVIKLDSAGHIGDPTNFLVRSRAHWVERGYSVLLPDAPLGGSGLMGKRITESYGRAVAALVNYARETTPAPVWLVGTSQGTNAVVGAASRLTHGEIAGIILTSTVTEPGKAKDEKETVFNADLAGVNVPVLVVADADDTCSLTPPDDREKLRAAFTSSPLAKAILVSGGKPAQSAPCEAESGHGFYGIEVDTIKHMASFIAAH
jgi:predicted alpha/beta hydrolase family esterase